MGKEMRVEISFYFDVFELKFIIEISGRVEIQMATYTLTKNR